MSEADAADETKKMDLARKEFDQNNKTKEENKPINKQETKIISKSAKKRKRKSEAKLDENQTADFQESEIDGQVLYDGTYLSCENESDFTHLVLSTVLNEKKKELLEREDIMEAIMSKIS